MVCLGSRPYRCRTNQPVVYPQVFSDQYSTVTPQETYGRCKGRSADDEDDTENLETAIRVVQRIRSRNDDRGFVHN